MGRKRLFIIFAILLILLTTSCNYKANEIIHEESIPKDTLKETQFSVPNDGGSFSNNDLIYFIMTDRFYDGDKSNNNFQDVNKSNPRAFHGGDLKGITAKLDYIKSLGATAIWITPVAKNQAYGYHGYWITDFYEVDLHLGTLDDLKNLVNEAHKRDIKVILDYVVNHTGYDSPWLKDENYKDWFHPKKDISNWNNQEELENRWLFGLPDLDQNNLEVRKFLIDNALWWINQTGIDGMRLDTMRHVPKDFWNELAHMIKTRYPHFYLLGEVWSDNPRYLEQYHQIGIDGLTNYPLFNGIRGTFTRFGKTSALINAIDKESYFTSPHLNGIFVDNHDNKRLVTVAGEYGHQYLKQALTFIMTYPAIPIIYYGTEIAMEGGDDPDNRRDMEWGKTTNSEMLDFYKKLVNLRQNNEAIREGEFQLLDYDTYFISYTRQKNDSSVIVILNILNNEKEVTVNIPTNDKQYTDILTDRLYNVDDGKLKINLKPLDIMILKSN